MSVGGAELDPDDFGIPDHFYIYFDRVEGENALLLTVRNTICETTEKVQFTDYSDTRLIGDAVSRCIVAIIDNFNRTASLESN